MRQDETSRLYQSLIDRFSKEELRTLCFDLGVEYEDLPGEGRAAKARELVAHLDRRDRLSELIQVVDSSQDASCIQEQIAVSPSTFDKNHGYGLLPRSSSSVDGKSRVWDGFLILVTSTIILAVWILHISLPGGGGYLMPDWTESIWLPLVVTVVGGAILLVVEYRTKWFARWRAGQKDSDELSGSTDSKTPEGIRGNIQIGNSIIDVLRGTKVFRNLQIFGGRIEVRDQEKADEESSTT